MIRSVVHHEISLYFRMDLGLSPYLAKREQETFEEGSWLVQSFLQRHVALYAQFLIDSNLLANPFSQDIAVKPLGLFGIQIGSEDLGCC